MTYVDDDGIRRCQCGLALVPSESPSAREGQLDCPARWRDREGRHESWIVTRAIPEIVEEIQGINDLLEGRRGNPRVVDPAIRRRLGRRRRECKDEKIEAERRLREGE